MQTAFIIMIPISMRTIRNMKILQIRRIMRNPLTAAMTVGMMMTGIQAGIPMTVGIRDMTTGILTGKEQINNFETKVK